MVSRPSASTFRRSPGIFSSCWGRRRFWAARWCRTTIIPALPPSRFSATPFGAANSPVIRAVLGRRLELRNSRVVTVVGVAPPGLEFPSGTEMWVPFANLSAGEVVPLGRLSSHATAREAAAELRASFEREPKNEWRGLRAAAVPLPSLILGEVRPALLLLTVAAAVLLLTACFNVSNLLLLRGAARQQEIAVRAALGASHGRIIRLLLVESLPLALLGGLVGAWVATELVRVLVGLAPANIPRLEEVRLQGVPLGLAVLVASAAALGSGVMPALWLSRDVTSSTEVAGARPHRKAVFAQRAMVVFQMGLAVFVLFVAGLLVGPFRLSTPSTPGWQWTMLRLSSSVCLTGGSPAANRVAAM